MLLLMTTALAHPPTTLTVQYTVTFDMDAMGDRLCAMTKICDCTSTYTGTGTLAGEGDGRATWKGTWAQTGNTCADELTIWTPEDGEAFHTLRTTDGKVTEWIVHGDEARNEALTEDMKAKGQFWMNELGQPWPAAQAVSEQTDGTTLAGAVKLSAKHRLVLRAGETSGH